MRISDWSSDVCSSDLTFEQLRSLEQVVKNIKANGGGHLRLGVVPSLGLSTAPRAISRFRELHPDVTFDVRTLHHDDLFQTLYERECDLAIVYSPPDHPRLKRSEERSVGKACASTCRSRWSTYH